MALAAPPSRRPPRRKASRRNRGRELVSLPSDAAGRQGFGASGEPVSGSDDGDVFAAGVDRTQDGSRRSLDAAKQLAASLQTASEVLPYLFIGSYGTAEDVDQLESRGITHVVSLVDSVPPAACGRATLQLEVSDWGESDLAEVLRRVSPFIDDARTAGGRVLIFCVLGVNRSPAVAAAYLRQSLGWSIERTLDHISTIRPALAMHDRYVIQLQRR